MSKKSSSTAVAAPVAAVVEEKKSWSQGEILQKLSAKEITVEQANDMLRDMAGPRSSNQEPRITEKGSIFIMPGFSVTGYQATKFLQHADKIKSLIAGQITGRDSETADVGRDKKEFKRLFRGSLLVGYQKDHVAVVSEFFRK